MAGINRAEPSNKIRFSMLNESQINSERKCVFLSHKSEDKDKAIKIGDFLMKKLDLDIYLDIYDNDLQEADKKGDHKKITEHIESGIKKSTHILCLISNNTKLSWWVPYEIGYAKKSEKNIATLKFKEVEDLPSFLKIVKSIETFRELNKHLMEENLYFAENFQFEEKIKQIIKNELYDILE